MQICTTEGKDNFQSCPILHGNNSFQRVKRHCSYQITISKWPAKNRNDFSISTDVNNYQKKEEEKNNQNLLQNWKKNKKYFQQP